MPDSGHGGGDILSVEGITLSFGGVKALDRCTWTLRKGVIAAVIGPNGAGKSTLVNVISGALRPEHGKVRFYDTEITGWAVHRVAQLGLIRTFQIARGFEKLTVLENMLVAPPDQPGESVWNALMRPRLGAAAERRQIARALELLQMFDLHSLRNEYAKELSGGQKRLLELARALMAEPKVLILDEPMAAISPALIDRIGRHLRQMREWGITLLLIEHNLGVVEQICDWVTVMVQGSALASGSLADLRKDTAVISAYLGATAG
jgi:ABC-type branched-subunit amino acid transport system ATPase component